LEEVRKEKMSKSGDRVAVFYADVPVEV